ncbi:hypothetical protein CRUP_036019 [Coryphaenoides rupestris]|nr:hypothetical protein CRUP_036019 [Coryphaenoides rupestris]
MQELSQRWDTLSQHTEARVRRLKEALVTVQQLDSNMSSLRSWLSRVEARLHRPVCYSACHHQEIQLRLADNQELQRDIEQHMEGVASVLSLCDALRGEEEEAGGGGPGGDSLLESSRSLDQRWRAVCSLALDRRLRIEETWRLWSKFLDDYSRFEDWLKMAERTAAAPNSTDVLYTAAKEELKKFESFQRQVNERLTHLELVNSQYRRLARESRTDRSSRLKAMRALEESLELIGRPWLGRGSLPATPDPPAADLAAGALGRGTPGTTQATSGGSSTHEEEEEEDEEEEEEEEGMYFSMLSEPEGSGSEERVCGGGPQSGPQEAPYRHFTGQREDFEATRESMLVWLTELDLQLTNVEHFSQSDVHHKIQQLNGFQKEITLNTERIDGLIVFGERLIQKSSPMDAVVIEEELEELHAYCQEVFSRLVRFHQRLSTPPAAREEPELCYNSVPLEESLELIGRPWLGRGSLPATPTHLLLISPLEHSGRGTPVSVDSLPLEWDHTGDVGGSSTHEEEEEEDDEEEEEEGMYFSMLSEPEGSGSEDEYVEVAAEWAPGGSLSAPSRSVVVEDQSSCWQTADEVDMMLGEPAALLTSTPQKHSYVTMTECWAVEAPQVQSRMLLPLLSAPREPRSHVTSYQAREVISWLGQVVLELEGLQRRDPPTSLQDLQARVKHLKEFHGALHSLLLWLAQAESTRLAVDLGQSRAPLGSLRQRRRTLTVSQSQPGPKALLIPTPEDDHDW